ncbi:hypothetical protein AG28_26165, partial [Salmonella enterica subsp. enterica]|nr:hypothetical protein [Salmonella enterica subsp. enterica]
MRNTKMNYFSGDNERTGKYIRISRQEAEKNFVLYFHRKNDDSDKTAPEDAIQKLENGEYDAGLVEGL